MEQSDFLKKLKIYIDKSAAKKNPKITANAVYFMTKQYPVIKANKRTYTKILKEVKKYLIEDFSWRMIEVHKCFCELNRLLKYF